MDMRERLQHILLYRSLSGYPKRISLISLRLIPTAVHTLEDVERTLIAFSDIAEKLKAGHYKEEKMAFFDIKNAPQYIKNTV
jgi:glycine C-acetyltransferase